MEAPVGLLNDGTAGAAPERTRLQTAQILLNYLQEGQNQLETFLT